jgi:DNA polymerase III epsilon subunit-like protein
VAAKAKRNILFFDTETWSLDIRSTELVELAAVVMDGESLEFIRGAEFQTYVRPLDWNNYHSGAVAVTGITPDMLRTGKHSKTGAAVNVMDRSAALQAFDAFVKEYRVKGAGFGGCPVVGGKNIRHFDLPLLDRICRDEKIASKDGMNKFFDRKKVVDLEDLLWLWFQWRPEKPADFSMDELRNYFGLAAPDKHGALIDAQQEGLVIRQFLRLHRNLCPKVSFAGSMREVSYERC